MKSFLTILTEKWSGTNFFNNRPKIEHDFAVENPHFFIAPMEKDDRNVDVEPNRICAWIDSGGQLVRFTKG